MIKALRTIPSRVASCIAAIALVACTTAPMPPEDQLTGTYVQSVAQPYQDVYRTIAKQMRACYRALGLFGNGYEVQADLDSVAQRGRIEVYYIGLTGAQKPEDSKFSRTVLVERDGTGSKVTTTGTDAKVAYLTHATIPTWLRGIDSCAPKE
jgi:hypothetical protein